MAKTLARRIARSFMKNEKGNVSLMTALSLVALVGACAVAIDISQGFNKKSRLADASDAVALMLAKSDFKTQAEMTRAAKIYLEEKYPGEKGDRLDILNIVRNGDEVTVQLANVSDAAFGPLFGSDEIDVSVSSSAVWSQRSMDIALVLDTTLSMEGTRMASLKTAATDMVNTIDKFDNDNVRLSVVPFSNYVNVGKSRRNAVWLDVPPDSSTTKNVCRKKRDVISRTNCRKINTTCDRDGRKVPCSYNKCDVKYGPEREVCGPETSKKVWHGCVGSRNEPYDTRVAYNGRKIPGLLNARCGAELQELSANMGAARSTIKSLKAQGNTYMPSGLMWGWRTLDDSQPLRVTSDKKVEKVLVLMTDGENTRSKSGDWHEARDKDDADKKTRQICNAIKNEDIQVYTIAYEVTDTTTKTLLENCASGKSNFFNARNSSELNDAFEEIANSLNELRISA